MGRFAPADASSICGRSVSAAAPIDADGFAYDAAKRMWGPTTTRLGQSWSPAVHFTTDGDLSVSYALQKGYNFAQDKGAVVQGELTFTPTYLTASGSLYLSGMPIAALDLTGSGPTSVRGHCHINGATWPVGASMLNAVLDTTNGRISFEAGGSALAFALMGVASFLTLVQVTLSFSVPYRAQ